MRLVPSPWYQFVRITNEGRALQSPAGSTPTSLGASNWFGRRRRSGDLGRLQWFVFTQKYYIAAQMRGLSTFTLLLKVHVTRANHFEA